MDSLKDVLQKKAQHIDLDAKKSELQLAQDILDRHFNGAAHAQKIIDTRLHIQVNSSSLASEVRLQQVRLLDEFRRSKLPDIKRLIIRY